MSTTFPPPEPVRHGIAELLRLLDAVRRLAFDRSLDDAGRARRLRDLLNEHDGVFHDPDEGASC